MGTHAFVASRKQGDSSPMHCFSGPVDSQDPRRSSFQSADREGNRSSCDPPHAPPHVQIDPCTDAFSGIVGSGQALQFVLHQVRAAAPTDCTVLLEGETGTGKELIARAIHKYSARRGGNLVQVNCASIPRELMESDLFGHEKGAFTGAIAQKLGRFELAHNGTLFLDEVGDLPLDLQPKLLRALQEQEFERLGSTRTRRVNVRLVAATNRGLAQLVREGRFRSDLYYRLNIFPISLPPLRQRREDIPALIRLFVDQAARKMGKEIPVIPEDAQEALVQHDWPGNIRELQNFIERAVILSTGPILSVPPRTLGHSMRAEQVATMTLDDLQRGHILKTLEQANWVVGGSHGAAARLGLKRTTLISRMQRLGIAFSKAEGVMSLPTALPLRELMA
jgi:formate hydrogenlyase transcriptional activator